MKLQSVLVVFTSISVGNAKMRITGGGRHWADDHTLDDWPRCGPIRECPPGLFCWPANDKWMEDEELVALWVDPTSPCRCIQRMDDVELVGKFDAWKMYMWPF